MVMAYGLGGLGRGERGREQIPLFSLTCAYSLIPSHLPSHLSTFMPSFTLMFTLVCLLICPQSAPVYAIMCVQCTDTSFNTSYDLHLL
jgi:hypothetical protein